MKNLIFIWTLLWRSILTKNLVMTTLTKEFYDSIPGQLIVENDSGSVLNLSIAIQNINYYNDKAIITMETATRWLQSDTSLDSNPLMKSLKKVYLDSNLKWHPKIGFTNVMNQIDLKNSFYVEILHDREIWFEYQLLSIIHVPCRRIQSLRVIRIIKCKLFIQKKLGKKAIEWSNPKKCLIIKTFNPHLKIIFREERFLKVSFIQFATNVPYYQFGVHLLLNVLGMSVAIVSYPNCYNNQYVIFTLFHFLLWMSFINSESPIEISLVNLWIGSCTFWSGLLALLMSYSSRIYTELDKLNYCSFIKNQVNQTSGINSMYIPGLFKNKEVKIIESKIYIIHVLKIGMFILYSLIITAATSVLVIDYNSMIYQNGCP